MGSCHSETNIKILHNSDVSCADSSRVQHQEKLKYTEVRIEVKNGGDPIKFNLVKRLFHAAAGRA